MIEPTTLRTALAASDPYAALDALIRAGLAAGERTKAISDRLTELLPEVETWPEYRGDAADAFAGVMDALNGWCHPDSQYHDPPGAPVEPGANGRADSISAPVPRE